MPEAQQNFKPQNLGVEKKEDKATCLDSLITLRNDYVGKVPDEIFFTKIFKANNYLINHGIISDKKIIKECENFNSLAGRLKFNESKLSIVPDKKDIDSARNFLDYIIAELQK